MRHLFIFLLMSSSMILISCNDEVILNEDVQKHQVNEKILSLEFANSAEDIVKVYEYIVTEQDYLDAIGILERNNKAHLLEHLIIGEPEYIILRSGVVVQKASQKDYIEILHGTRNASLIGRKGGNQQITLIKGSFSTGTVIHELGHAFGLLHEQCKENRDKYVKVHWDNIISDRKHNFDKQITNCAQFDTFDFESIMLYGNYDFAVNPNLPTLTKNDTAESKWITNRSRLTQDDINIIPHMKELSLIATYVWLMSGGGK